jgi:hypothetical protein
VHDNGKESKPQELRLRRGKAHCDPDIRFSTVSLAVFHFARDCCATYAVRDLQRKAKPHSQTATFFSFADGKNKIHACEWAHDS